MVPLPKPFHKEKDAPLSSMLEMEDLGLQHNMGHYPWAGTLRLQEVGNWGCWSLADCGFRAARGFSSPWSPASCLGSLRSPPCKTVICHRQTEGSVWWWLSQAFPPALLHGRWEGEVREEGILAFCPERKSFWGFLGQGENRGRAAGRAKG